MSRYSAGIYFQDNAKRGWYYVDTDGLFDAGPFSTYAEAEKAKAVEEIHGKAQVNTKTKSNVSRSRAMD